MQSLINNLFSRTSVLVVALGICGGISGCDSETDLSVRAAEVEAAQEGAETFHEQNDACIAAFHECIEQGGDGQTCHGQIDGCERPDIDLDQGMCKPPKKDGDRPEGDGDRPPPPEGGDEGDRPPPPQDGDEGDRPPPPEGEEGDRPEGGKHGKGPGCRPPLAFEEIRACHDSAKACVDDGGDLQACGETLHTCIKDAVTTAFDALCSENLAACEGNEDDQHCAHMAQLCEEGVPMPPHPAPKPGN